MVAIMPPTGFHGLLGLLFAGKVKSKAGKVGIAWGSVFPDLDLLGSIILFVFTQDLELTIFFHRSVTHSFIVMAIILISCLLISGFWSDRFPSIFPFILGFVGGMAIHAVMDLFYLDGVAILWPIQAMNDRLVILDYTFAELTPVYNNLLAKVISTLDGGFEAIYYFVFIFLANRFNTDRDISVELFSKRYEVQNWIPKLKTISFVVLGVTTIFLSMAFLSISILPLDLELFIMLLYIPLAPVYLLSGTLPLIMRKTVEKVNY
ncbi:hypothetical protein CEE45_06460 [Candidatus Heimdallarchaeota archaeon B3_Heim]|nr:MAG: hypothetical protein CEE45_06460 [Candidatus Heimdallarchaeota archaeon B3_Heim]